MVGLFAHVYHLPRLKITYKHSMREKKGCTRTYPLMHTFKRSLVLYNKVIYEQSAMVHSMITMSVLHDVLMVTAPSSGGGNLVPVGSDTLNATRCELSGIYTILCIIECIIQYFHIESASIEIGKDCESGLNNILINTDTKPLYYVNDSHLDIVNSLNYICRTSILKIQGRHIQSHQADTCTYIQLDW